MRGDGEPEASAFPHDGYWRTGDGLRVMDYVANLPHDGYLAPGVNVEAKGKGRSKRKIYLVDDACYPQAPPVTPLPLLVTPPPALSPPAFSPDRRDEPPRRQDTMQIILDELNPDSAALPVWIGQTCLLHEMISCGIQEQAVRKTQYLLFQQSLHLSHRQDQFFTSISSPWAYEVAELGPFESQERGLMQGHVKLRGGETLLVYHNHSVSSKTHTPTLGRNNRICFPVLRHAVRTSSAARPDVRFLGEFNSVLDSLTAFSAST